MDQDIQKNLYPHLWSNSGFLEKVSASIPKISPSAAKKQESPKREGKKKEETDKH